MQNEAQYDLDRKAAKISALSSNNLDKYEYLTGEDLGFKPSTVEQAKFEYSPLGKIFNKGLSENDKKEGLLKRLKNIEIALKGLIGGDEKDKDKQKTQQNNNIDSKPLNVFDYLKSLSQEAKDLMDEIKVAENDIDIYKLVFIGSDQKKFNFNIFRMPLNFLPYIYNGKISLKEAEFFQRNLEKKIEELRFNSKPKYAIEEEEIYRVLMQANGMLEYRDKIIEAFRDGTFSSEYLKKSDHAAHDYVLKDIKNFIQKVESMAENINLSLFKKFFESLSPADYAKNLVNVKDPNENKEIVVEIKDRISK